MQSFKSFISESYVKTNLKTPVNQNFNLVASGETASATLSIGQVKKGSNRGKWTAYISSPDYGRNLIGNNYYNSKEEAQRALSSVKGNQDVEKLKKAGFSWHE